MGHGGRPFARPDHEDTLVPCEVVGDIADVEGLVIAADVAVYGPVRGHGTEGGTDDVIEDTTLFGGHGASTKECMSCYVGTR